MADRGKGAPGGPVEGTPEYDWLYGSKRRAATDDDATRLIQRDPQTSPHQPATPEQTRVLPTQPGPAGPPRGGGGAAPPTTQPPGRPAPPPKSRKPRRPLRWVKWALLAWLIFLIAVPLWAWARVDNVKAFPANGRPGEQPGTTYLIIGSDSRADLTPEQRKELGTGGDVGQRTDTIMLLHTGSGPNVLMSIPRDSIVEIPGNGVNKVNAAYAFGGQKLLVRTLENETGIRIDHTVEIGLGGFVDVVNAVGGIEICPTEAMKDPLANLDIKKGCQQADGKTALGYARSRHTSQLGDIDRARHQREVVSAVGNEAVSIWSVVNPVRYFRLNAAMPGFIKVSEGTQPWNMAQFALAMRSVDGTSGMTCGVPISDLAVNWDPERSAQLFELIKTDETDSIPKNLCTPSGLLQ